MVDHDHTVSGRIRLIRRAITGEMNNKVSTRLYLSNARFRHAVNWCLHKSLGHFTMIAEIFGSYAVVKMLPNLVCPDNP